MSIARRRSILPGRLVIEGARQDARGRRLADAAHAGQHIGLVDAADGEGIGERAHHRLLADQVLEARRAIFARQHAIEAAFGLAWRESKPSDGSGADAAFRACAGFVIHRREGSSCQATAGAGQLARRREAGSK